jgi:hypothetical protein
VYGAQEGRYLCGRLQIDGGKSFKFVWIIYYQEKLSISFEAPAKKGLNSSFSQ